MIDVPIASKESIDKAIDNVSSEQNTVIDKQYGDGNSSLKIVTILNNLVIDEKLKNKFLME